MFDSPVSSLSELESSLGYVFTDRSLLKRALSHPSVGPVNNQRMEFLGDAVLQLCVSGMLFALKPELTEGAMTRLRAQLVCRKTLSALACELHLGAHICMSPECDKSGGRNKQSILSDAMEALLAAVYLDGGLEGVAPVLGNLLSKPLAERTQLEPDSKSKLQELLQSEGKEPPQYRLVSQSGPPHLRMFSVAVCLNGRELGRGEGTSKKEAEQHAAMNALMDIEAAERRDEA